MVAKHTVILDSTKTENRSWRICTLSIQIVHSEGCTCFRSSIHFLLVYYLQLPIFRKNVAYKLLTRELGRQKYSVKLNHAPIYLDKWSFSILVLTNCGQAIANYREKKNLFRVSQFHETRNQNLGNIFPILYKKRWF